MSWWSIDWWYDFIVTPLAEKFGWEEIMKMPVAQAFALRKSVGARGEIESYVHWKYDKDNKNNKTEGGSNRKSAAMPTPNMSLEEKKNVMESSKNWFQHIQSRGFGKYKENVVKTIRG